MRRRTASHCAFRQIRTSNGQLCVASPKTPALSNITGNLTLIWCLETRAQWDPAVGCLELRIRQIGPSNRRAHAGASKISAFDMLTVESVIYLVRDDVSRSGCGGEVPRIAHECFAKLGPRIENCVSPGQRLPH